MRSPRQRQLRTVARDDVGMDTPAKRLKWARERAGYDSARAAAGAFGWNASTYSGHENGQREFPIATAKRYGQAFGVGWIFLKEGGPAPQSRQDEKPGAPASIPTRGEVAAGRWLDLDVDTDGLDYEQFPIAAHPGYPFDAQYGLVVRGTSINRVAKTGEVLHCIDVGISGIVAVEEDIVIVLRRRHQDGLREVTAKRLRKRGNVMILAPDSTDPRWQQPIELDTDNPPEDEDVSVIAVVIGKYEPLRKRK